MCTEGRELVEACQLADWELARELIVKNPRWLWYAEDRDGCSAAYRAASRGSIRMLEFMLSCINRECAADEEFREQTLIDTFERSNNCYRTPAHAAARSGNVECLKFLVEVCPSGAAILEEVDISNGHTTAHSAMRNPEMLQFIVQHAPSGKAILDVKDHRGKTPLEVGRTRVKMRAGNYVLPTSKEVHAMDT